MHQLNEKLFVWRLVSILCSNESARWQPNVPHLINSTNARASDAWKHPLGTSLVRILAIVLTVKFNIGDESCSDACALLEEKSELFKQRHTSQKYNLKNQKLYKFKIVLLELVLIFIFF